MIKSLVLLFSLIVPLVFSGLMQNEEYTPAYPNGSHGGVQTLTVSGAPPTVDRMLWTLDIVYPVKDYDLVSSGYGWREVEGCKRCSEYHKGLDFVPGVGSEVYAIMSGVVTEVQHAGEYGMHVIISHKFFDDMHYTTVYAHLKNKKLTRELKVGQEISKGDLIGYVGDTGLSTGPHLHFEVRLNDRHLNPAKFLAANIRDI
jgi:murein DD-endopeptidase MepM/ murein hydrolase activator NlpD